MTSTPPDWNPEHEIDGPGSPDDRYGDHPAPWTSDTELQENLSFVQRLNDLADSLDDNGPQLVHGEDVRRWIKEWSAA